MLEQVFLTGQLPVRARPLFFGCEDCTPGHEYSSVRTHYIIHMIQKGSGTFFAEGKRYALTQGQAFIIFPGQKTRYTASAEDPWEYVWCAWDDPYEDLFKWMHLSRKNPIVAVPEGVAAPLLEMIRSEAAAEELQFAARGWFFNLLHYLSAVLPLKKKPVTLQQSHNERMLAFIHAHFTHQIQAADVARHINIDRSYASRLFKQSTGTTIQNYIAALRLERAKELLLEPLTVKEVCFSCGYSEYRTFLKNFKGAAGMSPGQYRRQLLNNS